jgi:hypothetical protein
MADTTETKTYIIKIQSDLDKYTKEAIAAKKALEDAKFAVDNLKNGQFKSREEIEKTNAAYRAAKKEYADSTKLVDLANKALKAKTGSYEQLLRVHSLMQTALKLESDTMRRNTDGTLQLTEKYILLSKETNNVKIALDSFGKGIHDNRLNVGNYSEAIEGALGKFSALPGPIGKAASAVQGFGTQLKALIINPIMLAIAALGVAMVGLYKVFVSTAEGAGVVKDAWAGLKAQGDVLRDRTVSLIDGFKQLFTGEFTESAISFSKAMDLGGESMHKAAQAAMELSAAQRELNKQLAFHISEEADENLEIQKYLFLSKDKSLADQVRLDMLQKSLDLMKLQGEKAAAFATEQFRIDSENAALKAKQSGVDAEVVRQWIALDQERQDQMLKGSKNLQDFYNRIGGSKAVAELETSYARIATANTELFAQGKRAASQLSTLTQELQADNLKYWEERWKNAEDVLDKETKKEEELKKIRDEMAKKHHDQELIAFNEATKFIDEEIKQMDALAEKKWKTEVELGKALFDLNKENAKKTWDTMLEADKKIADKEKEREDVRQALMQAGIDGARAGADAVFEMRTNRLNAQMQAELSNQSLTEKQRSAIIKKYAKEQQKMAIMQAVINGALGVTSSLTGPPIYKWIEAAAVAVATLAQIAVIKSQSLEGSGGGGSAPTAISGSQPAQRTFATPAGSSIFTQPQLSQPQLNAIPNQNLLTAADIANALKNLPTPVVTVEDINAKVKSVNKVAVRANI